MSLQPFPSNHRRPRIATAPSTATISPASSAAALVPRSVSTTSSSLAAQRPRALSPPSREPIESYTLWQPILRASDQIVLYNPDSHAINIVPASLNTVSRFSLPFTNGHATNGTDICPYCHRPMDELPRNFAPREDHPHVYNIPQIEMSPDYFQVLQDVNGGVIVAEVEDAHDTSRISQDSFPRFEDEFDDSQAPSRRWSRVSIDSDSDSDNPMGVADRPESLRSLSGSSFTPETTNGTPLGQSTPVRGQRSSQPVERSTLGEPETGSVNAPKSSSGYYSTFFREETRLGMGANGSVYLCQHVLNGIPLGHFAVKKIAVGDSTSYLMEILREVRLHEKLHHRNIITYHHAWLESARFSTFGLAVPTLHVLMQWAELGSLDDLILQRLGVKSPDREGHPLDAPSGEYQTREDRIRAFRARAGGGGTAHASGESRRKEARRRAREMKAVHLLSAEEIHSLFGDVVAGLAFLHESSFLHLDLKPGNVLLTLDEGQLVPRAMLSDFGTAQDALQSSRERSGNTGTLEYSSPESLRHNQDGSLRQITSKSDMWSLGMILHKLIYFRLPWKNDEDMGELEKEIIEFQGYKAGSENVRGFTQRRLPVALCQLLSKLLDIDPFQRPGSDQVLRAIRARQLDPSTDQHEQYLEGVGPLVRRHTPPSRGNESLAVGFDNDSHISGPLAQEPSPDMPSRDGRSRPTLSSQVRRSESVGELEISDITPRLLVLDGPTSVVGRIPGSLSAINATRVLSRGFKCALLISKTRTMSVVDDEMELDSDGEESMQQSEAGEAQDEMLVDLPDEYIFRPPPEEAYYGQPRLDRIPGKLFREIMLHLNLRSVISVRMTSKALDQAVSTTSGVWYDLVRRSQPRLLMGAHPVMMPFVDQLNGFQEDLLRCAYTLRSKWPNPGFQARLVTEARLLHTPSQRVEQIHFVPDTMGRFFLTVTQTVVTLWTLEPDGLPHRCRIIFQANPAQDDPEQIVQSMVARPGQSLVSYLAIQLVQGRTHELRTEIYQLRLSLPGADLSVDFGLCTMYDTEGALVAFSGYAAAYALNDAAQTILLCCWVTGRATRLATPVRESEIRWQHASCRAVTISRDIIVVVRDSTAEIYPRDRLTLLDPGLEPPVPFIGSRWTQLHMLPITYATDVANFPSSFAGTPAIHIHQSRLLRYGTDANRFIVSTQVISVIGVARSDGSPSDPSIPYIVVPAKPYQGTFTPSSSQPTSPSHTAPPSPTHTTPSPTHTPRQPSPTHTQPGQAPHGVPRMLIPPMAERDRFVFHIHALRLQNPHLSYGPIVTGPQGRCVMLASNIGLSGGLNQPRQFLLKFRHPSFEELVRSTTLPPPGPRPAGYPSGPRPNAPSPHPPPQFQPPGPQQSHPPVHHPVQHPPPHSPAHHLPVHHHPQPHPPQQGHVQLPPVPPHPLLNPAAYAPPPLRDPFTPLLPLMKPHPLFDVLRGMSHLWYTYHKLGYELLAWEEGSGTILLTNERGDVAVLECARPPAPPLGASSWHLAPRLN